MITNDKYDTVDTVRQYDSLDWLFVHFTECLQCNCRKLQDSFYVRIFSSQVIFPKVRIRAPVEDAVL